MLKNLDLGVSQYSENRNKVHKPSNDHWDIFNESYYDLISSFDNWAKFRRNGITCMLETGLYAKDRSSFIKNRTLYDEGYSSAEVHEIKLRVKELEKMIGKDFLYKNLECEVGSPRHCTLSGHKINFDDLYNVYAAWQIYRTFKELNRKPTTILEIGGGYGNLCNKLTSLFPNVKYIMLDLPETLVVQEYYLSQANPSKRLLTLSDIKNKNVKSILESDTYDVALLPAWYGPQLEQLDIDLVVNARSLGEMNVEALEYYFDIIHNSLKLEGLFYCVNRYVFTSSQHQLKLKDYPFDEKWGFLISQPQWLQTHLHEFLAIRRADNIVDSNFILKSMSERVPPPGPVMENILSQKEWFKNNKREKND